MALPLLKVRQEYVPATELSPWTEHTQAVWPVALAILFEITAIIAIFMRFWAHRVKKQEFALHDYMALAGLFFSSGLFALLILAATKGGLGQHALDVPPKNLVIFLKIYVANTPIWAAAITSIKTSILLLYVSIFRSPGFVKCCYALIGVQFLWCIAFTLVSLLLCRPIAMNWNPLLHGKCGNGDAAYITAHTSNLIIDVMIALCPTLVLRRLQMKRAKKVGIALMFAFGLLICIISIARLILYRDLKPTDITSSTVAIFFFTSLEPLLGIVLCCLPILRPAMQKISASLTSRSRLVGTKGSSNYQNGRSEDTAGSTGNSSKKDFKRLNKHEASEIYALEDISTERLHQSA